MSDWAVGDLALCVSDLSRDPWAFFIPALPRPGGLYSVSEVRLIKRCVEEVALSFNETYPKAWFAAVAFRKIKPLSDEERNDAEAKLPAARPRVIA